MDAKNRIVAFLPCRAGSQRVINKNTRIFAGQENGLLGIKLNQLGNCSDIDHIIVSTNDDNVKSITEEYQKLFPNIHIDQRPDELCTSGTSTDSLIEYASTLIDEGCLLWTHVTSPMVDSNEYSDIVKIYNRLIEEGIYDSLMSVTKCQTFIWDDKGPINYDRNIEKWPRTQTLTPLYMVNSAVFMIDAGLMRQKRDRIGYKPFLYLMDEIKSFEIDWEDQFKIAQSIYETNRAS